MVEKMVEKWLKINIRTGLIHSEKPKTKNNNDEPKVYKRLGEIRNQNKHNG